MIWLDALIQAAVLGSVTLQLIASSNLKKKLKRKEVC